MLNYIQKISEMFGNIIQTAYGKLLAAFMLIFNFFMPEALSFMTIGLFVFMDWLCGIWASVKQGKYIVTDAWKDTFEKGGIYAFLLIGVYLIEMLLHDSGFWGVKLAAAVMSACELWSMSASLLIVKPNMPFLKLFRMHLKGEIEKKLNKKLDSVFDEPKQNKDENKSKEDGITTDAFDR